MENQPKRNSPLLLFTALVTVFCFCSSCPSSTMRTFSSLFDWIRGTHALHRAALRCDKWLQNLFAPPSKTTLNEIVIPYFELVLCSTLRLLDFHAFSSVKLRKIFRMISSDSVLSGLMCNSWWNHFIWTKRQLVYENCKHIRITPFCHESILTYQTGRNMKFIESIGYNRVLADRSK